jgi:glutamyl-tRNA reductase
VHVLVLGLHSSTAPLALRERAAFPAPAGAAAWVRTRAGVAEALVLSTCNRMEVYAAVPDDDAAGAAARVLAAVAERAGVEPAVLAAHARTLSGADAAAHLCRVAAGLDSVVLGESQITGQLRRALAAARADGALGGVLERLGSTALGAGRRARARFTPSAGPATVAQAAVHALDRAGVLRGARVLVMGAGETATDVLAHLPRAGVAGVTVTNRSAPAGRAVAERYGAGWADWDARTESVAEADVVFTCIASAEPVVDVQHLPPDPRRRVHVVDLGVPRNVAPAVRERVTVWDVDTLAPGDAACCPRARAAGIDAARREAEAWAGRFVRWLAAREAVPVVARLRATAEQVREQEVARALARLDGIGEREQAVVRALAARLVNKLLHAPVAALGSGDAHAPGGPTLTAAARQLFALDPAPPPAALDPVA